MTAAVPRWSENASQGAEARAVWPSEPAMESSARRVSAVAATSFTFWPVEIQTWALMTGMSRVV
jgi:hypothetical protein